MSNAPSSRGIRPSGSPISSVNRVVTSIPAARLPGRKRQATGPVGCGGYGTTRGTTMHPGAHAADHPDKPAIIMAGSGETITYAELAAEADRIGQLFRSAGLEPGDHVAFCLENHPRFLPLVWGAFQAGLVYTAMSSRLTTDEMAYIVNDCGARAFITSRYKADAAAELVDQIPAVELRLM